MSEVYIIKNSGPIMDPWSIPEKISCSGDVRPLYFIACVLHGKKEVITLTNFESKSKYWSLGSGFETFACRLISHGN